MRNLLVLCITPLVSATLLCSYSFGLSRQETVPTNGTITGVRGASGGHGRNLTGRWVSFRAEGAEALIWTAAVAYCELTFGSNGEFRAESHLNGAETTSTQVTDGSYEAERGSLLYIETPNKTDPQPARFWFEEDALVVLDPRYDIRVYYRPAAPSDVNSEKPLKGDLFTAIRLGNIDAVTSMTSANPSLVEKRRKGRISPLYWAVMWGQIDIVKLLIAKGADVNAKDEYGGTPLHQAAWHGFADIADLLISKGGNVNATNVLGASPLKLAQQLRQTNVVQILREHGGKE